ncbi:universal stress protein UspA-like protein [Synechococcus sp. PCC 7502]|uniref:universal stress protein n=1 Tax=Synechococcus sp. PCC 7502 TaxID=1173263 RepID=UPI00029FA61C|nr:universal stress protein [Synechococcus sp. PCC 7502]AFY73927.1 universal stress protein UspA-like protein [Synechococcus sp. PCC 7502]
MKFLVAIDGSHAGYKALQSAISLAKSSHASILAINVIEPLRDYYPELIMPTGDWVSWQAHPNPELEKALVEKGRSLLQEAEKSCQEAEVECTTSLEFGSPRDLICKLAKTDIDVLVVGSRGLGSMERLMLGSVSDYVVHHAPCPVLVVR